MSRRFTEAKANLAAMEAKVSGMTRQQQEMINAQPNNAAVVADSLITALQLASPVIADPLPNATRPVSFSS
jgi:hypothetical protein